MNRNESTPGRCQVVHIDELELAGHESFRWARVFGPQEGARALSLFFIQCGPGETPFVNFGSSESVLYLLDGQATAIISGVRFNARNGCGLHVRQGEDCQVVTDKGGYASWLAVVCPQQATLNFSGHPRGAFDRAFPDRLADGTQSELHSTADRFYRLLVGPSTGSESVTQFIGKIPKSKAPEHYHLYEEVICILSGEGRMWAGEHGTDVKPGSLIFLPRGQRHSLECTSHEGMELVGMFYPAGSPAINYQ